MPPRRGRLCRSFVRAASGIELRASQSRRLSIAIEETVCDHHAFPFDTGCACGLDFFRFPGFPQQRSLSGGKQRRNSASSEEAPAAQLPRPGGVGCCVEKTAALSDLKTCTTSGICDSVLDSSVALPDALARVTGASRVDAQNRLAKFSHTGRNYEHDSDLQSATLN